MFKILEKRQLTTDITLMRIDAPRVAAAAKPGQFVIVRVDEKEKTVYFSKEYEKIEANATLPLREGMLTVRLERGARSVETTGGYQVKVV